MYLSKVIVGMCCEKEGKEREGEREGERRGKAK